MALVSPGIQISINDQSQYVNSNVGSVPLMVLATAQNKTYNGSPAMGTSKANAGKLLSFSSQRDLVTQMGTPTFQLSSAGTPVNGSEINEYGLLTAYSALGLSNQLYAIRADVDLAQLVGTGVRPIAAPADNTYWLDTTNTTWGLYETDLAVGGFSNIKPTIITSATQVSNDNSYAYPVPTPISSVGNIGDYALVFVNTDESNADTIRLFYKAGSGSVNLNNTWVQVGSPDWQKSVPTITGTISSPVINVNSTLVINTVTVSSSATLTTVAALAASINSASITGVYAVVNSLGQLELFATNSATSDGTSVDGILKVQDGTFSPLATAGIKQVDGTPVPSVLSGNHATYYCPYFFYGTYAQAPSGGWFASDTQPRPSGSIWWKTSATGGGLNIVLKKYNTSLLNFQPLAVPAYPNIQSAIYSLDPLGGGVDIPSSTVYGLYELFDTTYNSLKLLSQKATVTTQFTSGTVSTFTAGNQLNIGSTVPGSLSILNTLITLSGTTATSFVSDILAAGIPYVTAQVNSNNTVSIINTSAGLLFLENITGTPLTDAGFTIGSGGTGYIVSTSSGSVYSFNASFITDQPVYSASQPYSKPAAGTYWYYSNAVDVDIMINDNGWKGYHNVTNDARGYNLSNTSLGGVIVTPTTAPTSQSDGTQLVAGDLWLDSGDLVNYPSLYRYNGNSWVSINNTDHVTSGGIIFADARWDSNGTTDIISGNFPTVTGLLTSNYLDLDAPDYRLYPRGMLLFNTRRSGYNIKKFVPNYFNSTSFPPNPSNTIGLPTSTPAVTDAWVSASGLDSHGVMRSGSNAQRAIVVGAMQSAIDSNLDILSTIYQFNLLCAPNYPELIPNMLTLNNNRNNTAFVIGDTPMDLNPSSTDITNWANNTSGNGLPSDASVSPYLALYYPAGRTNDLAGNTVVVPASHAVLRTYLYSDQISHPWFAPAGLTRGLVSNLSDIGYIDATSGTFIHNSISQGLCDALFTTNINPITQLPGSGLVVFGQLTRSGTTTARNRVNVVRLENYLRTIFASVSNGYLFEPNDAITRKSIATQIENSLNNVLALRGLYDFLVICDTSNNTPGTISNNQLYVDVAIEPMRDVEFIYIPIAIYNPGSIAQLNTTST